MNPNETATSVEKTPTDSGSESPNRQGSDAGYLRPDIKSTSTEVSRGVDVESKSGRILGYIVGVIAILLFLGGILIWAITLRNDVSSLKEKVDSTVVQTNKADSNIQSNMIGIAELKKDTMYIRAITKGISDRFSDVEILLKQFISDDSRKVKNKSDPKSKD